MKVVQKTATKHSRHWTSNTPNDFDGRTGCCGPTGSVSACLPSVLPLVVPLVLPFVDPFVVPKFFPLLVFHSLPHPLNGSSEVLPLTGLFQVLPLLFLSSVFHGLPFPRLFHHQMRCFRVRQGGAGAVAGRGARVTSDRCWVVASAAASETRHLGMRSERRSSLTWRSSSLIKNVFKIYLKMRYILRKLKNGINVITKH